MTPTSTLGSPVVRESAAAAPEASANATESRPACVRARSSGLDSSDGQKPPITTERDTASAMPTRRVFADSRINGISPKAVPSPNARFGPSSGAITIAPITTATLFSIRPMAATTVDSMTNTIKFMSSRAFFATPS